MARKNKAEKQSKHEEEEVKLRQISMKEMNLPKKKIVTKKMDQIQFN